LTFPSDRKMHMLSRSFQVDVVAHPIALARIVPFVFVSIT